MTMCWEWRGRIQSNGYGRYGSKYAHRLAYEILVEPIPEGMCVLHACDNRACFRPDHLFIGTLGDNNRDRERKGRGHDGSKTHCKWGHEFSEENTWLSPGGTRFCRACLRRRREEYKQRQRNA